MKHATFFVVTLTAAPALAAGPDSVGFDVSTMRAWSPGVDYGVLSATAATVSSAVASWAALAVQVGFTHGARLAPGALGLPPTAPTARLYQLSPGFLLLLRHTFHSLEGAVGAGFAYHMRFVQTESRLRGTPIDAQRAYGHVRSLTLIDHPGFNAQLRVAWRTPWSVDIVATAGMAYAVSKVVIEPEEDEHVLIARRIDLSAWLFGLGARFRL